VTTINSKMGLKPAGKRSMMNLPADRALRNRVTSAVCPACQRTGARLSKLKAGWLVCSWCNTSWALEP
jgi:ribosomal protein L37AE/L43A